MIILLTNLMFYSKKKKKPQIIIQNVKKKTFKRLHKGKIKGFEFNKINTNIRYGFFGLNFLKAVKLTQKHIVTFRTILLRKNLLNNVKDSAWIRGILDTPVTRKPDEIRMGKGKGPVDHWILKIKPGKIFFELSSMSYLKAQRILNILTKVTGVPGQIVRLNKCIKNFRFLSKKNMSSHNINYLNTEISKFWGNENINSYLVYLKDYSFWYHSVNGKFVIFIFEDLIKIIMLLVSIAYFTLAERKIMAAAQRRFGPNVNGIFGILQPLADGLKLVTKEMVIPTAANSKIFLVAPLVILIMSLTAWSVIPFGFYNEPLAVNSFVDINSFTQLITGPIYENLETTVEWLSYKDSSENFKRLTANINYVVLFLLIISSINVYGIIIAGWASNSKYAFLGSLRSAAQMISYEVAIGLVILPVVLLNSSLNLTKIIFYQGKTIWYVVPLLPSAVAFLISMLAETNRTPFDLTEAEAELVAGYNTEYSSIIFAMFFLAEYSNMILMSTFFTALFLGGWYPLFDKISLGTGMNFIFKILLLCVFFVIVRASFPRYRYDQLMNLGWKIILPITLSYIIFVTGLLLATDSLNYSPEMSTDAVF